MEIKKRSKKHKREVNPTFTKEDAKKTIKSIYKKNVKPNIKAFFNGIKSAILFILRPSFTSIKKENKREFNTVYFYIFICVSLFYTSVGLSFYMVWHIAFGVVNNPQVVASLCGGLVTTLIVLIDRMLKAYNEGKNK